jgi:hypothetical protein
VRKQELQPGKIPAANLVEFVARYFKLDDYGKTLFRRNFNEQFPDLLNKERCANCNASMMAYVYQFDYLDAQLLIGMAGIVKQQLAGKLFTEANKVHVQSAPFLTYAEKSRTTQCEKLGLVAKVLDDDKKHIRGTWLITKRGWVAMRGEPVPAKIKVFRDQIVERFETDTTTISSIMAKSKKKEGREFNPMEFYDIELMAGRLL